LQGRLARLEKKNSDLEKELARRSIRSGIYTLGKHLSGLLRHNPAGKS
jgi:hypothetical protein